jgi:pimeloyl-ACP methyl ester carboxylesterase
MSLFYQEFGSGTPLVILHGLLGSSDNWRGFARQLADSHRIILIDLPNHGRSPHHSASNFAAMAEALADLLDSLCLDKVNMIGHSIGGKVGLQFATQYPQKIERLMVVDMAPRGYTSHHEALFQALLAIDLSQYQRRSEVDAALAKAIPKAEIRQFLLMNLQADQGVLSWRIDLPALYQAYPALLEPVCEQGVDDLSVCFVRGERSDYLTDEDLSLIQQRFPNAVIESLPEVGHWVHIEAPQGFLAICERFFND